MTPKTLKTLDGRLQRFLEDLTEPMGRSERRRWARVYWEGLLLDGERKSIERRAAVLRQVEVRMASGTTAPPHRGRRLRSIRWLPELSAPAA